MNCPACNFTCVDGAAYCGHCRFHFSPGNFFLTRARDHFYWVFRRAIAGFFSGAVAWFFIPALARVISRDTTAALHFAVQGLLGGAFLGTVDGMVEESTPKTILGGALGGLGGAVGGAVFGLYADRLSAAQTPWGIFGFWALAGCLIGLVSALWERNRKKLLAGALSGAIGGGIGGALGYAVYAYVIQEFNPVSWLSKRLCEGFSGGLIGITLWFAIGLAERLIIFHRRPLGDKSFKVCDHCGRSCPLNTWYCGQCGSVLQQSASAARLNLTPYATLDRLREMFRFTSRLSATTGVVAGLVVYVVFLPVNAMLAFVALVLVAAISYIGIVLFSAASESLRILIDRPRAP